MKLLLATRSSHKAGEIREILANVPDLELLDLNDAGLPETPEEEGIEVFETFEDNALAKALHFKLLSGLPTLADDSGLSVDALEGAPGVHSKRFAPDRGLDGQERDDDNNRYLLERLAGVPKSERSARYVCVAVLLGGPDLGLDLPDPLVIRGEAEGRILDTPLGDGGFGYDPLFFDPAIGKGFAELSPEGKNSRSHRGKAFRALAARLEESHG
jgi:XTP/dITP diphosphohydrolase